RTEQSYVDWCHRFLRFCGDTPMTEIGAADVQRFLSHLAVERNLAASTQSVALNAVVFLFNLKSSVAPPARPQQPAC
ncbi:MAG: site-specific integrase, partial [Gammaproteobacteria bacterium]